MGLGDKFLFYPYHSDDSNTYVEKLSENVAAAGGFGAAVDPNSGPGWLYGAKSMRHVYGLDPAGNRTRLPISEATNTLYTSGGAFTLNGRTYAVEGMIGEKRSLRDRG